MSDVLSASEIISLLDLQPLEGEGGFFRQTYLAPSVDDGHDSGPVTTAILFLITPASWSGLHRLETDELFHFYLGDCCRMVVCSPQGELEERCLGADLRAGCRTQVLVPGGWWQGTMLEEGGHFGYALLGTTMTPGFRADQFTLATKADLADLREDIGNRLRPFIAPQWLPEEPGSADV